MNRAMFSGVAGLKTHQTKMDVIGNNIANVNTFGFKSQRAVFSDIFYQTIQGASGGTANRGGTNPSSVGYGAQLASIQTQMTQSSMQSTGYGMDVAITGEGFFQVMDPDGNIFYTKAGIFDYDANGYLVDLNGNFVLGATSTDGEPDSRKIKLDDIGSVTEAVSTNETTINGITYTISAANKTNKGNLGLSIASTSKLPKGQDVSASISSTGTVSVLLSENAIFTSLADLSSKINSAITEANGGKTHTAGSFTVTSTKADEIFATTTEGLTGAQICGTDFNYQSGKVLDAAGEPISLFSNGLTLVSSSSSFTGDSPAASDTTAGSGTLNAEYTAVDLTASPAIPKAYWTITLTTETGDYTGTIVDGESYTELQLKKAGTSPTDFMTVRHSGFSDFTAKVIETYNAANPTATITDVIAGTPYPAFTGTATIVPAKASVNLGLGSSSFTLAGGTAGGPITLDQLTSISIGADGIISVTHPEKGTVAAGRICLANFANPAGLELNGTNYYTTTANSGDPQLCDPGSDGSGSLKSNALEMSNVDLSAEFADMITTQRGFQANSRIITVSDTMLEELINLKR